MRIAIVVDTFPSLSETFISNKVERLVLKGHELIIFCNKKNDELFTELFNHNDKVKTVVLNKRLIFAHALLHPVNLLQSLMSSHYMGQAIYKSFRISIINKYKPDIIHFEFSGIGIDYLHEIKFLKALKIISCRGSAEKVKLLIYSERQEKFRKLLNLVDGIHCVSDDIQKTIQPYCRDHKKIFINHPSIDTTFFKKQNQSKKGNVLTILSVGRLTFQKGYSTGLLAIHSIKDRGVLFKWLIVGSGPNYEEIMFQINELKLNEFVVLVGARSRNEVKQLMEESDIYLLSSVYEGIANVALEAMSMELPVVSTRSGGMEEVIMHKQNGLLADVYDHITLSENLFELLANPHLRLRLGKAGRRTVTEKFDLNTQINKFENTYAELLNGYAMKTEIKAHITPNDEKVVYYSKARTQKKSLRVGVIVPQFPSYTETFFINKIIGLCERGHEVVVFCNTHNADPLLEATYHFNNNSNLKIITLDFNRSTSNFIKTIFLTPFIILKNIRATRKSFKSDAYFSLCKHYFNKHACDIYHFGYSGLAVAYTPVLEALTGKIIVSCLGTAENVKPITEKGRSEKLYQVFKRADKIHCVSSKMAETIKKYGAINEKIFINRPAVDTKFFLRKKQHTHEKHVRILSIGRLVFQKGFFGGILAIAELKKRFQNFTCTIIGEGPEKEEIIFHINAMGLEDHVKLIGKKVRDEIIQFYDQNDIFFLPSVSEGLANVVLEAMSMEMPVVSSINGGIEEVITNRVNGILCDNYNFISMGQELFNLCTDFESRRQLGKCARKTIEKNFDIKRYIDVFEEEYCRLVQ
jgi:colanic acid/amylovoran biosynthesis glycosyltransferase